MRSRRCGRIWRRRSEAALSTPVRSRCALPNHTNAGCFNDNDIMIMIMIMVVVVVVVIIMVNDGDDDDDDDDDD